MKPSTQRALLAGLALGLACLAKVTAAPLAIPLALALARVPKPQARRALVSLLGLAACVLPWAVRNQRLVGRFEFSNNNGGLTALGGTVSNEVDWNGFPELREALDRWEAGEKMRHTTPDRFFYRVALERIGQHPWRWLRLVAGRVLRFALPYRGYFAMVGATRTGTLGPFYLAGVLVQALLFGACLRVGWLALRRRVAWAWAVAPTIVLVHWAVYALSFATPRYNVSFGPLLGACLLLALWHGPTPGADQSRMTPLAV